MPGHSDIIGNEEADKLAKQATNMKPSCNYTSFAFLGIQINKIMKSEYNLFLETNKKFKLLSSYASKYLCKVSKKILLPSGINRETASSFFQLKLGHRYLKAYLYKLGITQNKHCICGSIETTRHLLLDCKEYRRQRVTLLQNIRKETSLRELTLGFLLHTKIGIKHILVFLKETNICTRKWHLERSNRVEEENEEEN